MNFIQLLENFPTHRDALKHLEYVRWHGEPVCPYCESDRITAFKNEDRYKCRACLRSFSVRVGTVFEDTRLDMRKWFLAVALMLNAKKGISALQLSRDLHCTYKTAWYACMRIRCAMAGHVDMLTGVVQADTAYIGGKPAKNVYGKKIDLDHKAGAGTKKIKIFGAVEQRKDGKVIAQIIPDLTTQTLLKTLKTYVETGQTKVMTDAAPAFKKIETEYSHLIVNHSKEFANGSTNLNKIEGFFGLLKRGHFGQYHQLSEKYLPFYLAEFTYRYNERLNKDSFEKTIQMAVENDKCMLHYKCDPFEKVEICSLHTCPKC